MFSGLGTIGKWIGIILIFIIVLAAFVGYNHVFAAIGDLIHHVHNGVKTTIHHAKHG